MACLIFDLDGTLVDSKSCILESFRFALKELGLESADFDEVEVTQRDLETSFRKILAKENLSFDSRLCQRFIDIYRKHQLESAEAHICLYEGVKETLDRLQPEFRLAVATTKHSMQAKRVLKRVGILEAFEHVQGTDPGLRYKPYPDILLRSLEVLKLSPNYAAYMGDSVHDMKAARTAGLHEIGAGYGFAGSQALIEHGPHWILDRFDKLLFIKDEILGAYQGGVKRV